MAKKKFSLGKAEEHEVEKSDFSLYTCNEERNVPVAEAPIEEPKKKGKK